MRNELYEMLNELNRAFYEGDYRSFPVDVEETKEGYEIICELAGVNKEDIKVDFNDSILTISAKKHVAKDEKTKYLLKERTSQKLRRSLDFGNTEAEEIKAKFENGLLTVTLITKKPEEKVRKNIVIE